MTANISIEGFHVGDRVLAVKGNNHIFNKITKIEVGEGSVHFYVSGEPLTSGDIIANVTTSGVKVARQLLEDEIAQQKKSFLSFCETCMETWKVLNLDSRCDLHHNFYVRLDDLARYRKLLEKLENYEKSREV